MSPGASRARPIEDSSGAHRQIFAIRHQVRLVVAADDRAAGADGEDAVGRGVDSRAVGRLDRQPAGEQPSLGPRHGGGALDARRRLRRSRRGGCPASARSPPPRATAAAAAPRVGRPDKRGQAGARPRRHSPRATCLLPDIGLDDADVHHRQRVFGHRRGRQQPQEGRSRRRSAPAAATADRTSSHTAPPSRTTRPDRP